MDNSGQLGVPGPPAVVDFGIKKTRKYINRRKKLYTCPFGDKFTFPEVCQELHNKDRFNCLSFTHEDVLAMRNKIYATHDKIAQDKFASQFVVGYAPKRRRPRKDTNKPSIFRHGISMIYTLENRNGKKINVCKSMFTAVTGFSRERIVNVAKQSNSGQIKEKRGGDRRSTVFVDKRIIKLVQQTEKELEKEKQDFTNEDNIPLAQIVKEKMSKKERKRKKQEYQEVVPEHVLIQTDLIEPKSEIFGLELFDLCRICLQNESELVYLFEFCTEDQTNADLVQFCLPLKVRFLAPDSKFLFLLISKNHFQLNPDDGLPQNICKTCLERVQISCKLKSDYEASAKIMDNYLKQAKVEPAETMTFEAETLDSTVKVEENFVSLNKEQEELPENEPIDQQIESEEEEEWKDQEMEVPEFQDSTPKIRPIRCYLCDCEFDSTPEIHFEISHNKHSGQIMSCTKCEFQIDSYWYLNLHYQVHADGEFLFSTKIWFADLASIPNSKI